MARAGIEPATHGFSERKYVLAVFANCGLVCVVSCCSSWEHVPVHAEPAAGNHGEHLSLPARRPALLGRSRQATAPFRASAEWVGLKFRWWVLESPNCQANATKPLPTAEGFVGPESRRENYRRRRLIAPTTPIRPVANSPSDAGSGVLVALNVTLSN